MTREERQIVTKNIDAYIKSIERKWSSVRAKWRACKNQKTNLDDWSSWFREFEEIEASLDYIETTMIGVREDGYLEVLKDDTSKVQGEKS